MKKLLLIGLLAVGLLAFENVDAKRFAELAKEQNVVILDVRTPGEFREGHIPGANLVPVQVFQYLYLGGKGLKDKKVLVYCHSGNRSVTASRWLDMWGVKEVYNLKGGILEWKAANLPLDK